MKVVEQYGKFKIFRFRDWTYLCQLVNNEWEDLVFDTRELAEREIEQIRDHETAIETQDWDTYCKKWNVVLK